MRISFPHAVLLLAVIGLSTWLPPALAGLHVPGMFGDGMVLQREHPVPIWGTADPGDEVTVSFAGQQQHVRVATDGRWRVQLNAMLASAEPRSLVVQAARERRQVTLANVVVGDVWLVSGDFGVYWETWACLDAEHELPAANHPQLRLLKVWGKSSNQPLDDILGEWRVCTPENVRGFSALGYFYGRALQRELHVPIGIIDASYRYSVIQGWMPPEAFRMVPELSLLRTRLESWDPTTPTGQAAYTAALARIDAWLPAAKQAFIDGKPIPEQPLLPAPVTATDTNYLSISEISLLYHGMIRPLMPMRIRGVVWSLGENSCIEPAKFHYYLQGLMQSWRQAWGQGNFPFYLEMLPQVNTPTQAPGLFDSWSMMREGVLKSLALPSTGMVVTFDVSDFVSDQRNRQDPAERLARLALAKEYGRNLVFSGPLYRSARIDGDRVILTFDQIGGGLVVGEKRGLAPFAVLPDVILKGFAVAGADKKWVWADARIVGDTVVVRSDQVPSPVAVRYACGANPVGANLYNRDSLPAAPFRTDAW